MKTKISIHIVILAAMAIFTQCAPGWFDPVYVDPNAGNQDKTDEKLQDSAKVTLPVIGDYTFVAVDVPEMSGLCFGKDSSFLWAVGDKGDVCKVSPEGKVTEVLSFKADLEDVTADPATGNLLAAVERTQTVCRIDAPAYNSYRNLFLVREAVDGEFNNDGLEGISYYKDGIVFIGSQKHAILWKYKLDGTMLSSVRLSSLSSEIEEIGGLCYDKLRDRLWVTDSEAHKLFLLDAGATKLLASYDISFIDNAESVCVDHRRNCVWVGSDEKTSKLYKIAFADL